jgi:hypothetical protein
METKALKPTFSRKLQSSTAVHRAPLWLIKPTFPRFAISAANVAFNPLSGLMTPRQFGPMMRILAGRACSRMWASSWAPSAPISFETGGE